MSFSFKQWYEANGDRLNKNRRDRYKTDPDYREQVLERNRVSRQKRREVTLQERAEEHGAILVKVNNRPWKAVEATVEENGKQVKKQLLTIGAVAKAVGRSVQAVRLWEKQGKLPPTPHHNAKGDRLYTPEMVEDIVASLKAQGKIDENKLRTRYVPKGIVGTLTFSDGKTQEARLFRIGVLARSIDRTVITVEQLEQKGHIPATPFRASKTSYRLYTVEMIEAVAEVFGDFNGEIRGAEQWKIVHSRIKTAWEALGVFSATFQPQQKDQ